MKSQLSYGQQQFRNSHSNAASCWCPFVYWLRVRTLISTSARGKGEGSKGIPTHTRTLANTTRTRKYGGMCCTFVYKSPGRTAKIQKERGSERKRGKVENSGSEIWILLLIRSVRHLAKVLDSNYTIGPVGF